MANILALDDNLELCKLIRTALERDGHRVETRQAGGELTEALCRWADCILLDVMMPGEDGFAVCRRIRSLTEVPILFLSARTDEAAVLEGLGIPPETAVLLLVALLFAQHFTDLAQILQSKRIVSFPTAAFLALVWGINHQRSLTIAMALVFAIPAIASIVMGFKVKPTGANEAIARTHIAFRRRAKAAGAFSLVAMICVTVALTYGVAQTQKVVTLSPPEDYSLADGVVTIKFSQISDGHLHRFEYRAKDGTSMRFIIIKKNGGAYGVGLDACDNCGDAGYYEKDGKIICKKCDVAINLATIGFKGGCNPIPFDYQVKPGKIVIQTSTLDALSSHFQ